MRLWAINHRPLAEALTRQARETDTLGQVLDGIRNGGTTLNSWGWVNGVSDELNRAHAEACKAAAETTEDDLRTAYEGARDRFKAAIDEMAEEHKREEDEDW